MWEEFDPDANAITDMLRKYYDVAICNNPEDADYIICSVFGQKYDYCRYPQPRIMIVGENYIPDFNLVDYAICSYDLKLFDRNFCIPSGLEGYVQKKWNGKTIKNIERKSTKTDVQNKEYFACFIASHESEDNIRGDFFKKLNKQYRRVESVGTYLNNMPWGKTVNWRDSSKIDFQSKCKFALCFESTKHQGFNTEKILEAYMSNAIPIYFGSESIFTLYNKDSFIYCGGRDEFDNVVEQIIRIDCDEKQYLEMVNQPILAPNSPLLDVDEQLCVFLKNIFDQNPFDAYRRSRVYWPRSFDYYLASLVGMEDNISPEEPSYAWLAQKAKLKLKGQIKKFLYERF